ncbi:serine proteinase stubble [Neocloeon triangulifer]|uniref:serine proteinase stubble n=1 Tax=Neocloeon triangulifer TaxID=2078957 RepID=UPI00286EDAAA|nr:serine proteinase stubble [Neocloeon triangulifer]XP_059472500.1 serine proteinase stubble [Neocloeon triangulifer]
MSLPGLGQQGVLFVLVALASLVSAAAAGSSIFSSSSTSSSSPSSSSVSSGRVLVSLLGYPSSCVYNGGLHACTFSLACWLVGGQFQRGCGGPGWLVTCCVPARISVRTDVPGPPVYNEVALRNNPYRREHDESNELTPIRKIECGVPQIQEFRKRIIGGDEAYFGEFPWQAHIRISGYQCGGVLVSRQFIATAAHCIHRARLKDITIYLGEYDTQDTGRYEEPLPSELHKVAQKIVHPKFQYRVAQPDRYDLALLRLARPVYFKENILPICLPREETSFQGQTGVVAGWGKTDTSYGKTGTNILQKATVPILRDDECLMWHKQKNIRLELFSEMFCAGHRDGHMDACLGDSGGPLIVNYNGRWTLAGITSAGFGCAVDHQPGIYHKVAVTSRWIVKTIANFSRLAEYQRD